MPGHAFPFFVPFHVDFSSLGPDSSQFCVTVAVTVAGNKTKGYNIVGIQLQFTLWCVNASQDFQLHAVTSMAVTSMGAWFRASRTSRMRESGWNHLKSVYSMAILSTWLWKALCWKIMKLENSPQNSYGLQFQHSKLILQLQLQLVSTTQPVGWILTNEWV